MSEITEKVMDVVCKQLNVSKDKLTPETSFVNDLSADSLDLVELVMELEDQFGVSIPDEEAEKIQTIGDAIKYVEGHA
jgi:acyl carrier protein